MDNDTVIEQILALMLTGNVAEVHIVGKNPLVVGSDFPLQSRRTFAEVHIEISAATGKCGLDVRKACSTPDLIGTLRFAVDEIESAIERHKESDA